MGYFKYEYLKLHVASFFFESDDHPIQYNEQIQIVILVINLRFETIITIGPLLIRYISFYVSVSSFDI